MVFISNIFGILDIFLISVAGIMLKEDLVVRKNIELFELARNSYNSSLFFRVFCRFYRIMGDSVAFIYIKGAFDLNLIYLFYFYNAFYIDINVLNNNANLSFFNIYSLF